MPYLAQINPKEADVVVLAYAGADPIKFVKQYRDQGLGLPLLGGSTVADDSIIRNFGDEAIGLISTRSLIRIQSRYRREPPLHRVDAEKFRS